MADDSDVPPLEDMTDVLKKFALDNVDNRRAGKSSTAKERAKVKKNTAARVVQPKNEDTAFKKMSGSLGEVEPQVPPAKADVVHKCVDSSSQSEKLSKTSSGGMFGGMKKGFLFGPSTNRVKSPEEIQTTAAVKEVSKSVPEPAAKKELETDEEIPYICPKTGKTGSGLTLDEVQQAMSETKGLLENQDWINDDLLSRLEQNEFLIKRFADPHFMKALQEFQANPQAALEKYKTNKEVERFLMEFCALLGDHFTKFGDSTPSPAKADASPKPVPLTTPSSGNKTESLKPSPKIIELPNDNAQPKDNARFKDKSQPKENSRPKDNTKDNAKPKDIKKSPKIVELTEKDSGSKLKTPKASPVPEILELNLGDCQGVKREIPEITPIDEKQLKELLREPKVMEILLDPEIMNLVQTLKTDPDKAHKIVEKADAALRDKITFLVSKRILDFQVQ